MPNHIQHHQAQADRFSSGPNNIVERRKHRRHIVEGSVWYVSTPYDTEPFGQLVDISQSGLSYVYPANTNQEIAESDTINIIGQDLKTVIESLYYRNVNDWEVTGRYPAFKADKRRRGLELIDLSQSQIQDLINFIRQLYPNVE